MKTAIKVIKTVVAIVVAVAPVIIDVLEKNSK